MVGQITNIQVKNNSAILVSTRAEQNKPLYKDNQGYYIKGNYKAILRLNTVKDKNKIETFLKYNSINK